MRLGICGLLDWLTITSTLACNACWCSKSYRQNRSNSLTGNTNGRSRRSHEIYAACGQRIVSRSKVAEARTTLRPHAF
jgi:hypothetical protein